MCGKHDPRLLLLARTANEVPPLPLHVSADLKVLGGLEPLVSLLADDQVPSLQAGAAYVLGTAVSSNEKLAGVLVKDYPKLLQQLLQVNKHSRLERVDFARLCRERNCCLP